MMRATELILAVLTLSTVVYGRPAAAIDEQWAFLQVNKKLEDNHSLSIDYLQRDREEFFKRSVFSWIRISSGWKKDGFRYSFGVAHLKFAKDEEIRLHQSIVVPLRSAFGMTAQARLVLEERRFRSDPTLILRTRFKLQAVVWPQWKLSPALYNETFAGFQNRRRSEPGLNENRLGAGLSWKQENWRAFFYFVAAHVKKGTAIERSDWLQLYMIYDF